MMMLLVSPRLPAVRWLINDGSVFTPLEQLSKPVWATLRDRSVQATLIAWVQLADGGWMGAVREPGRELGEVWLPAERLRPR